MRQFKVGDTVKIIKTNRSGASRDLLGKKGKVLSAVGNGPDSYCVLDIALSGIYNDGLKLVTLDWDE